MRKREKFIISSTLLAIGLFATQVLSIDIRPFAIALFTFATYIMSAWALSTNINGIEWITVLPFPTMYALAVSLFYFLLPENFLSRIAVVGLFGIGMYALLLTSNIYAIGRVKTIQLLRAAHAVGSVFLLLMAIFFFNFIFSLQLHPLVNMLLSGLVTFPLMLCSTWSLELEPKFTRRLYLVPLMFSFIIAQCALAISFLPVGLWSVSLFLTALLYVGFGLIQHYIEGRLFRRTTQEYLMLAVFVTISFLLLIHWK
ncbi:hypothetical protein C5B42_04180 [Candidatus Cerribacteria bacterium 'Amazon FNV 2010 28 9']|uniref:Uncharacterized protein n=1 Tax=Candidatus Cerribacteria bacterium 'Amazon FNV 2010 28 9' TaxID=2081795 RepID=A0A317JQV9_9BACT|nr:MAG: hypothetical protein C5B42_04180 [Candidatus Cerribacteria bacterium 'Amazon FNV 2010 28 9']